MHVSSKGSCVSPQQPGALPPQCLWNHLDFEHRLPSQGRQCPCLGCVTVVLSGSRLGRKRSPWRHIDGDRLFNHVVTGEYPEAP